MSNRLTSRNMSQQEKAASLLLVYKKDPILAIESLFSVKLDKQQKKLIQEACKEQARVAVKSCQGAGKTSCLVWLTMYFLLTLEDCRILITAPSSQQLHRVFHSEFLKWHAKLPKIFKDFFEIKQESVSIKNKPYQVANLVTGNPQNRQALQGGHADNYIILADEANGLSDETFDTLLGTLGTGNGSFIQTCNPVENKGRLYEIFKRKNERWVRLTFNAFDSDQINKSWIEDMREQYGEEDDNWKIRVLGEFGSFGSSQFFPTNLVEDAVNTNISYKSYMEYPKVVGVDIARYGDDDTVFLLRQGPKILDIVKMKGFDTQEVAYRLREYYSKWTPNMLCIDGTGLGAGVVDRIKEFQLPHHDVIVSQSSTEPLKYLNLRAQLYGKVLEWLQAGADIPDDPDLFSQLVSTSYTYTTKLQVQMLSKKEIKRSGLPSPDIVDALSLSMYSKHSLFGTVVSRQKLKVKKSNYLFI